MPDHDWLETKLAELITRARRSKFFTDIIRDAEWLEQEEAVVWDVALARAVAYWCDPLPHAL